MSMDYQLCRSYVEGMLSRCEQSLCRLLPRLFAVTVVESIVCNLLQTALKIRRWTRIVKDDLPTVGFFDI